MIISMKKRVDNIKDSYAKAGVFKADVIAYSDQLRYEVEQDLIAMKWALYRMGEFLRVKKETGRDFVPGDNEIEIGYQELLKRISEYSCPNMRKDGSQCPLKEKKCSCEKSKCNTPEEL